MSGTGKRFERELAQDLQNFAKMVTEAPPGALDPNASNYIFHSDSAAARRDDRSPERNDEQLGVTQPADTP